MSLFRFAVPLAAMLALGACSDVVPEPASATAPATAAPAESAETPGPNTLTSDGLGPIRIGMADADARAAIGAANIEGDTADEVPGACVEIKLKGDYAGLWLMAEDGRITRITAGEGSSVLTDKGLGVRATPAAVRAAYPTGLEASPHKYEAAPAEYLTVWAVPKQKGLKYEVNGEGVVGSIHAGGPSIEYVEGCL